MRAHASLLVLLLAAIAPSIEGSQRRVELQELQANRAKWQRHGITDYEFRQRDETCFCMYGPYYGPIRVIVAKGKVKKAIYEGERRDGYWPGRLVREKTELVATVEDVFRRADGVINARSKAPYTIRYDPTYGFPTMIDVQNPPGMADAQWRLVVDGFTPRKSQPDRSESSNQAMQRTAGRAVF
ncbi:MAG: DUF6174 domain-containing protein [Chthoniobacterales bacterium]